MKPIHQLGLTIALLAATTATTFGQASSQPAPSEAKTESAASTATTFLPEQAYRQAGNGPITMDLDPQTLFPPGGPPYSLFSPFEIYARPFAALVEGSGPLSRVLSAGAGLDLGARSFLYNSNHSAAWYGDIGLGYQYNRGSDPEENVIVRTDKVTVSRFGTPVQLDAVTSLGVRELHRTAARIAFGREYYWHSSWTDSIYYSLGGDVGGIWGQASVKTDVNNRDITGLQANDVINYNPKDGHSSQITKGFFLGSSFNIIVPRRTHDFIIGTRIEWQREYFNKLVDNNDGTGQLKLMMEIGWRY